MAKKTDMGYMTLMPGSQVLESRWHRVPGAPCPPCLQGRLQGRHHPAHQLNPCKKNWNGEAWQGECPKCDEGVRAEILYHAEVLFDQEGYRHLAGQTTRGIHPSTVPIRAALESTEVN